MNRRYLNITAKNSFYNEVTGLYEIDFPIEFIRSSNEKRIIVLGVFYLGNIKAVDPDDWVSLHSPTLANGTPQEIDNYITMAQYPSANWVKEYKIDTKDQKFLFEFRHLSDGFNKQSVAKAMTEQFVIELELIWL